MHRKGAEVAEENGVIVISATSAPLRCNVICSAGLPRLFLLSPALLQWTIFGHDGPHE
jgi:hypothetical protein